VKTKLCCLLVMAVSLLPAGRAFSSNLAQPVPYRFRNVAIVAGGFVTGFVAQPQQRGLYYLRTDMGGAYRWDAARARWIPLLDWLSIGQRNLQGVESIAIDPTNPRRLYIAAGTYVNARTPDGAILCSDDQGRHFTVVPVPFKMGGNEPGRFAGERLQVDPNHPQTLLMGTRLDGLWRSGDYGRHWRRVLSFPAPPDNLVGLTFVAFDASTGHPGQPTPVIYVGEDNTAHGLLRSADGGATWQPVPGEPTGIFPNHGTFSSTGILYLSYTDAPGPNGVGNGAVWAYTPRSSRWRDITPEKPGPGGHQRYHFNGPKAATDAQGFGYGIVAVDPEHPQTLLASTIDRWHPGDTIFRSTDGGAHWISLKPGATRDSSLSPYLTHTLPEAPFGHWIGSLMIDPFHPAHVLYGTGETVWESHDVSGPVTHWTIGGRGIEQTADIMLLSPLLPGNQEPHLFSGLGDIGCFRNDDFNHSPAGGAMKNPELSNCDSIALAARRPEDMVRGGRSWTPGPHGAVSHDGGLHWTPFASEPEDGVRGGSASISADGSLLLWAVPGGPLALSSDSGAHWQNVAIHQTGRHPLQVLADALHAQRFWVYDPAGLLYSVGSNRATHLIGSSLPKNGRLRIAATAPGTLWISSRRGLWRSNNGGQTFVRIPSVASAVAVGFGKHAPGAAQPAIYLIGAIAGTPQAGTPQAGPPPPRELPGGAVYRSLNDGRTWQRIDTPRQRLPTADHITGDPRIFGRVYVGTNGRGVFWGDPAR
jgi:photosystem II stability/assembly factor-like uncharacterized protein